MIEIKITGETAKDVLAQLEGFVKSNTISVATQEPLIEEPSKAPKTKKKKEVEEPKVADIPKAPSHFYSEEEFTANLPKILNDLTVDKLIDNEWIKAKCAKLGVTYIFSAASDHLKCSELFNDLILEGKITKKGNY